jgi:hypothetical protein
LYEKRRLLEASDSDEENDAYSSEEDKFEYSDKKVSNEPYEEAKVSMNDRNASQ